MVFDSEEDLHYQIKKEETCPMASAMQGRCPFSGTTEGFRMRPQDPKYLRLMNWVEGKETVDTLHQKATNVSKI